MTYAEVDQCWCCKTLRHCSAAKWKQTVKTIHHLDHLHMYRFEYFCPYSSICVFVYLCICVFVYLSTLLINFILLLLLVQTMCHLSSLCFLRID